MGADVYAGLYVGVCVGSDIFLTMNSRSSERP